MKREYFLISLFFLITAIIFYLFYQIIIPFFVPITWAAVFVILFFPLYERLLHRLKRPNLVSVLMCAIIVLLIIGPLTYIFVALVNEAADAVARVNALYKTGQLNEFFSFEMPGKSYLVEKLAPYYDISKIDLDDMVRDAFNKVSGVVVNQTTWLVANGTKTVFFFALFVFTMFYFFRDGQQLVTKIKRLLPLARPQVERAITDLRDVIHATIYGGVVIALLQGFLGGVLFVIMGISSPIFWGAVMALLSIIPLVGASLVYIPAGIILILSGAYIKGIVVILVGFVVISQVDNVIRPLVIAGKTSLHPLMLFFTIMGGIAVFGMLGLVIGPMIAAGFTIILRIFEMRLHPEDKEPKVSASSD